MAVINPGTPLRQVLSVYNMTKLHDAAERTNSTPVNGSPAVNNLPALPGGVIWGVATGGQSIAFHAAVSIGSLFNNGSDGAFFGETVFNLAAATGTAWDGTFYGVTISPSGGLIKVQTSGLLAVTMSGNEGKYLRPDTATAGAWVRTTDKTPYKFVMPGVMEINPKAEAPTGSVELMKLVSVPSSGYGPATAEKVIVAADGSIVYTGEQVAVVIPNV